MDGRDAARLAAWCAGGEEDDGTLAAQWADGVVAAVVSGALHVQPVINALRSAHPPATAADATRWNTLVAAVSDAVWVASVAAEAAGDDTTTYPPSLLQLVRSLHTMTRDAALGCTVRLVERQELGLLQAANLIGDRSTASKQLTRVSTRLLYTQSKYNLYGEESEGYAKLLTYLLALPPAANPAAIRTHIPRLLSLVGHFSLDPNRVFDIVLDAVERAGSPPGMVVALLAQPSSAGTCVCPLLSTTALLPPIPIAPNHPRYLARRRPHGRPVLPRQADAVGGVEIQPLPCRHRAADRAGRCDGHGCRR